jgi:hypothetical protein
MMKTPNAERRTPNTEFQQVAAALGVGRWALGVRRFPLQ